MKSKLVMLISVGALAFSAIAPNAMAAARSVGPRTVASSAVSRSAKSGAMKLAIRTNSAVPSHTILPGAKNNNP